MAEIASAVLWALWAAFWLFIGFLAGKGHSRKAEPKCLHWWEIVSEPWTVENCWDSERQNYRPKTAWHERCTACGELRTTWTWGAWTLEEITGERTYGTARNLPGA